MVAQMRESVKEPLRCTCSLFRSCALSPFSLDPSLGATSGQSSRHAVGAAMERLQPKSCFAWDGWKTMLPRCWCKLLGVGAACRALVGMPRCSNQRDKICRVAGVRQRLVACRLGDWPVDVPICHVLHPNGLCWCVHGAQHRPAPRPTPTPTPTPAPALCHSHM